MTVASPIPKDPLAQDPPPPFQRTVDLGGERILIPGNRGGVDRPTVVRQALIVSAVGIPSAIVLGVLLQSLAIAALVCLLTLFAIAVWAVVGLLVLPRITGGPGTGEVRMGINGLEWDGVRLPWDEVRAVSVQPYPFTNRSWVYCVEVRSADGELLRIGGGSRTRSLNWLVGALEAARARYRTPTSDDVDGAALAQLDALVGQTRVRS